MKVIRPENINTDRHFYGAFGWGEVEIAANYIVRLCQKLGGWKAFSEKDLNQFWLENGGKKELVFNQSDKFPFHWFNEKLLVRGRSGKYRVTDFFIQRCFHASPNKK